MHAPVRLAELADTAAIARCSRESTGLPGNGLSPARVASRIRDPETNVAVITAGLMVVAFGIMDYRNRAAQLVGMGVSPRHRGHGCGGLLLSWLEQCAAVAGSDRVTVRLVGRDPIAVDFYERRGYVVHEDAPAGGRGLHLAKVMGCWRAKPGADRFV